MPLEIISEEFSIEDFLKDYIREPSLGPRFAVTTPSSETLQTLTLEDGSQLIKPTVTSCEEEWKA